MPRAKRGNKRKENRKKVLKLAKGYRGTKSKLYRSATESVERALNFAYTGRKLKKRDFRSLWIVRIGAGARANGLNYSQSSTARCSQTSPPTRPKPSPSWPRRPRARLITGSRPRLKERKTANRRP